MLFNWQLKMGNWQFLVGRRHVNWRTDATVPLTPRPAPYDIMGGPGLVTPTLAGSSACTIFM
jgi:hypothetical protein